jgi:hypothetical protein
MNYLKLAPYAAIALLLIGLLFYRGQAIEADALKDAANAKNDALMAVNERNAKAMTELAKNAALNDQLVKGLAADVAAIKSRGANTRTIIKEAIANDPVTKAWGDEPIPDSVRDALRRSDRVSDAKGQR